jgi:SAM-dependent methyltransferase
MTYKPRDFWERRLREQFDLRGTGETGLSLSYNRACYDLRRRQLQRVLRREGIGLRGKRVLDVGCGTGFFTEFYLARGASVTGLDITAASVDRLREQFPRARFVLADVGDAPPEGSFDVVNAFDVLYHITDQERWTKAVRHLAGAVSPGGAFVITDVFDRAEGEAEHNVMRSLDEYREILEGSGLVVGTLTPTHVLLNRELGAARWLNRLPAVLWAADRAMLSVGFSLRRHTNKILVAKRPA